MKIARGSLRWAAIPAVGAVLTALHAWLLDRSFAPYASALLCGLALAVLVFHRDPERKPPPSGVLAPADGRVAVIREEEDGCLRVGTYMRGRDVHVNRAPMDAVVECVEHEPGANKLAFRKESERNERLRFVFEDVTAEMIAGAFARRTYAYVEPGDAVERGERIGHISFSSRFDLLLPEAYDREDLHVAIGTRVRAGETVLAKPRAAVESDGAPERESQRVS